MFGPAHADVEGGLRAVPIGMKRSRGCWRITIFVVVSMRGSAAQ
jgi:hypothetical protein